MQPAACKPPCKPPSRSSPEHAEGKPVHLALKRWSGAAGLLHVVSACGSSFPPTSKPRPRHRRLEDEGLVDRRQCEWLQDASVSNGHVDVCTVYDALHHVPQGHQHGRSQASEQLSGLDTPTLSPSQVTTAPLRQSAGSSASRYLNFCRQQCASVRSSVRVRRAVGRHVLARTATSDQVALRSAAGDVPANAAHTID